jgi:hypothetical protein
MTLSINQIFVNKGFMILLRLPQLCLVFQIVRLWHVVAPILINKIDHHGNVSNVNFNMHKLKVIVIVAQLLNVNGTLISKVKTW